jgi:hypothetical protein
MLRWMACTWMIGQPESGEPDPGHRGISALVRMVDHRHRGARAGLGRHDADGREHAGQVHRCRGGRVARSKRREGAGVEAILPAGPQELE